MKMKMNLYKVLKISFIIGLLVKDPFPLVCNVNNLDIVGNLPEADVPAQPDPVPVWGGDGPGQYSPRHRALGPRPHFLSVQPDKVK